MRPRPPTSPFAHPLLIGFAHLEEALAQTVGRGGGDGFPPYNLERVSDTQLKLVFAVAGFTPEDLKIVQQGRELSVQGQMQAREDATFLHQGIAARGFRRGFLLADGFDVDSAALGEGLLSITITRPAEDDAPREIAILVP